MEVRNRASGMGPYFYASDWAWNVWLRGAKAYWVLNDPKGPNTAERRMRP